MENVIYVVCRRRKKGLTVKVQNLRRRAAVTMKYEVLIKFT